MEAGLGQENHRIPSFYPLLDTCIYEVQFQNGPISKYAANIISETFTTDVNKFLLLNDILYNRSADKAVNPEDSFEGDPAKLKYKNTMVGWEL